MASLNWHAYPLPKIVPKRSKHVVIAISKESTFLADSDRFRRELTLINLRRTLAPNMPSGFDAAFAKVKELVAGFRANEKFHVEAKKRHGEQLIENQFCA